MVGLDKRRLALIHSAVKTGGGVEHDCGTGYFITGDLVLTARHVLPEGQAAEIKVRPATPQEGQESRWVDAERKPVWEDEKLDVALIRVAKPISEEGVPPVIWCDTCFEEDQEWVSWAYPEASSEKTEHGTDFITSKLKGTLLAGGGEGPGGSKLELTVGNEAKWWGGISGAPVFVGEKLTGIIIQSLASYDGKRLAAVPAELLLRDPAFRVAITPTWLQPFPQGTWVLILNQETEYSEFKQTVKAALSKSTVKAALRSNDDEKRTTGEPPDDEPTRVVSVSVTDALKSPEQLFLFIQAICAAPVMIFDVTDFEPAVMMFLGIRAVVRRGVTLTATNKFPDESRLSELPFNIQETKLIDLSEEEYDIESPRHPVNWIGSALVRGLVQLKSQPDYLDLPAYNAVRCPEPKDLGGKPLQQDKVLMLCSFHKRYKESYWKYVSSKIAKKVAPRTLERMLDIPSPRLVGLALYESIRWTQCCIVDWTQWRANVFFELGVRLACSDTGPISLIEEREIPVEGDEVGEANTTADARAEDAAQPPLLNQKHQLIRLLTPIRYKLNGPIEPFDQAFKRYEAIINKHDLPVDNSAIAHNAIYQTIVSSYYWPQEPVSRDPHEELRLNLYAEFGDDPQKSGVPPVLFSANPDFRKELSRNLRERWLAAWYYLKSRHSMDTFRSDAEKRQELIQLGEQVVQWLSNIPDYEEIRNEIVAVIDELEE